MERAYAPDTLEFYVALAASEGGQLALGVLALLWIGDKIGEWLL